MRSLLKFPLLLALVVALAGICHADRVVLVGGDVLEGEIVEESSTHITLQMPTGTIRLPRSRIQDIRPSAPGALDIMRAREALQRNRIEDARQHARRAEERGVDPEILEVILEEITEAEQRAELARYSRLIEEARAAAALGQDVPVLREVRTLLDDLDEESPVRAELINVLATYHMARADEHRDKVRIPSAVAELQEVIRLDPRRAEAYLQLGDMFKGSSITHDQAIMCYSRAAEYGQDILPPRDIVRTYWELGEIHRQRRAWRDAALAYREAHARIPGYNHLLPDRLIEAYKAYIADIERERPAAALSVAEEALKVRNDKDVLLIKARLQNALERHSESNETLRELLQIDPRMRNAYYLMGMNYLEEGELLRGREMLQREIANHPENFDALIQLGQLALQRDDYEVATGFFSTAHALQPDNPQAALGLGQSYRHQGELQKAREAVGEVLVRFPDDYEANLEMGRIYVAEERFEDARRFFTNVLNLIDAASPDEREELKSLQADALIARGELSLLTAGPGTANMDFRRALDVLPDYGQAYYHIGLAYRRRFASTKQVSDLKTAEQNLQRSRELAPENPQFALQLGILYSQDLAQADSENRNEYLRKAIEHWQSYIDLGGANVGQVRRWIDEAGTGRRTTEVATDADT